MVLVIHKFQCRPVFFVHRDAADADIIQKVTAHFVRRNPFRIVEKSLNRSAVGSDRNSFPSVLPHDPHDRFAHTLVDFDHRLSARRSGVASVLIEHIHSVKLRILSLYFFFGPAVNQPEVDLHDAGFHQHRDLMVLSRKAVLKCFDRALQRAGHPQIDVNVLEIFLQTGTLLLSYLIQRIVRLSLVAKSLIPGCGAVPDKIYSCFIHCLCCLFQKLYFSSRASGISLIKLIKQYYYLVYMNLCTLKLLQ